MMNFNVTFISGSKQTCGNLNTTGCAGAIFCTHGVSYSQVCGRLRVYQIKNPDDFGQLGV